MRELIAEVEGKQRSMGRSRSRDRPSRNFCRSRSRSRPRRWDYQDRHRRHRYRGRSRSASERRYRRRSRSRSYDHYRNDRYRSRSYSRHRSRSRHRRRHSSSRSRRRRSPTNCGYSSSSRESRRRRSHSSSSEKDRRRRARRNGRYRRRPSRSSTSSSAWSQLASDAEDGGIPPECDDQGHLIFKPQDRIRKYEISDTLGEGTFGKVALCSDKETDKKVAVKIIKNIEKYRDSARIEVSILKDIRENDEMQKYHCVQMLDCFNYYGHICIVLEPLGLSLYDFMKGNNYRGYPVQQVRHIGWQVLRAIKYIHRLGLTHTDLKPENILFVDSSCENYYDIYLRQNISIIRDSTVRLIDFGSATYKNDHHSRIVATRHYRPPEVILEMGWSFPLDIWSLGCILFELYTGRTLFQTHSNREHLAMMESYLSPFPRHFAAKSRRRKYFHHNRLDWDRHSSEGAYVRKNCKPLLEFMSDPDPDVHPLFDLILKMLVYEPKERYTASEALRHRFFDAFQS